MKTLLAFGALILIGWTTLAGGVIAVFAADPAASRKSHQHFEQPAPVAPEAPLMSDAPCDQSGALDGSVPCPA